METPTDAGERARVVEEVLPVLHVEHGIAPVRALVVTGRNVDGDLPLVAEDRRSERRDHFEPSRANARAAVEHTPEGVAEGRGHVRHRWSFGSYEVSRFRDQTTSKLRNLVTQNLEAQLAVPTPVVHQRHSLGGLDCNDLADEDRVIAARELLADAALERGDRAVDQRDAGRAAMRRDAAELVFRPRREAVRDIRLHTVEDADAELSRRRD